jgi:hypothetical protein
MTQTTQKHQDFISEPIGDKAVTSIAGIGNVLGVRLLNKGYDKAYILLGYFLTFKKDEKLFKDWLREACGCNSTQSNNATCCLKEWCNLYL